MTSVPEMAEKVWRILTQVATQSERSSGFVRRQSKLTGALFVQTVVLGWLAEPAATLEQVSQMAARLGVRISPQGLDQRFTPGASLLWEDVLEAAVTEVVAAAPAGHGGGLAPPRPRLLQLGRVRPDGPAGGVLVLALAARDRLVRGGRGADR